MIDDEDDPTRLERLHEWWIDMQMRAAACWNPSRAAWRHALNVHRLRHRAPDLHRDVLYAMRQARAVLRRGTRGRR